MTGSMVHAVLPILLSLQVAAEEAVSPDQDDTVIRRFVPARAHCVHEAFSTIFANQGFRFREQEMSLVQRRNLDAGMHSWRDAALNLNIPLAGPVVNICNVPLLRKDAPYYTSWVLPKPTFERRTNHGCAMTADFRLLNFFGQGSTSLEAVDVITGQRRLVHRHDNLKDPTGRPLGDIVMPSSVVVKVGDLEEIWIVCGFHSDGAPLSYVRIIDAKTLVVRLGPRVKARVGACGVAMMSFAGEEGQSVCSFGGSKVHPPTPGSLVDTVVCYNLAHKMWHAPLPSLPQPLGYAHVVEVPAGTCNALSPPRIFLFNHLARVHNWVERERQILVFDQRSNEWAVSFDDVELVSIPRAGSAAALVHGRYILHVGGYMHGHEDNLRSSFAQSRAFDVCTETWSAVASQALPTADMPMCMAGALDRAFSCGGVVRKAQPDKVLCERQLMREIIRRIFAKTKDTKMRELDQKREDFLAVVNRGANGWKILKAIARGNTSLATCAQENYEDRLKSYNGREAKAAAKMGSRLIKEARQHRQNVDLGGWAIDAQPGQFKQPISMCLAHRLPTVNELRAVVLNNRTSAGKWESLGPALAMGRRGSERKT